MSTESISPLILVDKPSLNIDDPLSRALSARRRRDAPPGLNTLQLAETEKLESDDVPGFFEAIVISAKHESVSGKFVDNLATDIAAREGGAVTIDQGIDTNFNPYSFLTPDMVSRYPFLIKDAEDGILGEVPNQQAFDHYLISRRYQEEELTRLNRMNMASRLTTSFIGQIPDLYIGAKIARGAFAGMSLFKGGASQANAIKAMLLAKTAQGTASRVGVAVGGNVFQELGIEYLDPFKNPEIDENEAVAGVMGLVLASAVEGVVRGTNTFQLYGNAKTLSRTVKDLRSHFKVEHLEDADAIIAKGEDELARILDEPIDGPREIQYYRSEKAEGLIAKIQAKYDEAGEALIVRENMAQELVMQYMGPLRALDDAVDAGLPAVREGLKTGTIDRAAQAAADKVRRVLDKVTPAGRLRRTHSSFARRVHRLFFDESMPLNRVESDPLDEFTPVSAEGIRDIMMTERGEVMQKIEDIFDDFLRSRPGRLRDPDRQTAAELVYTLENGEKLRISSKWHRTKMARAITDYIRKSNEAGRGNRPKADAEGTPETIRRMADVVNDHRAKRADQLTQVGLMNVSNLAVKRAEALVDAARAEVEDLKLQVAELKAEGSTAIAGAREQLTLRADQIKSKIRRLEEQLARQGGDAGQTQTPTKDAPSTTDPPAGAAQPLIPEIVRTRIDQLRAERAELTGEARGAEEGEKGQIARMRRNLQAKISRREQEIIPRLEGRVKKIKEARARQDNTLNRRWLPHIIKRKQDEFLQKLKRSFDDNRVRDYWTGARIEAGERELLPEVMDNVKKGFGRGFDDVIAAIEEVTGKNADEFIESDLATFDDELVDIYRKEVDLYRDRLATSTIKNIVNTKNAHGVQHGFHGANPLNERKLLINESEFYDFLEDNVDTLMKVYDNQLIGKVAARRAIQADADHMGPAVKELLNEELSLDPEQILRAMREQFSLMARVTGAIGGKGTPRMVPETASRGKLASITEAANDALGRAGQKFEETTGIPLSTLQDQVIRDGERVNEILTRKLDQLQGIPHFKDSPALEVGWGQVIAKHLNKLPAWAHLGMVTVSSLPDLANLMLYSQMNRVQFQAISGAVKELASVWRKIGKEGLEGLAVAIDDDAISRSLQLWELDQMPVTQHFGRNFKGRMLQAVDQSIEGINRGFFKSIGMNRWNTALKRGAARTIMWTMFDGAKRFNRALKLRDAGASIDDALRKVGLTNADASKLNRLGINRKTSKGIVEQFRKHGTDKDGRLLADLTDGQFENFTRIVHPNLKNWDGGDELVERFTAAVNAEVDNIIVTPNLMSRPLMNDGKAGAIAKVFHQFQAFGFAYGSQLAPIAAQSSAMGMSQWIVASVFFGAVSDSIHNHISGRRSFDQTADLWMTPDKVMGMGFAAIDRAGLTGWLNRPLGIMQRTGYGVGQLLGNDVSSAQAAQALGFLGHLGPLPDLLDRLIKGTLVPALDSDTSFDRRRAYTLRQALPGRNHLIHSLLYRFSNDMGINNPFGPGKGLDLYPFPFRSPFVGLKSEAERYLRDREPEP